MAKIIGNVPQGARRNLLGSMAALVSESARLKAEREEGEGLRRLFGLLRQLPDSATVILQPTLGFMKVECCVIGAGKVLVINTLHFKGKIGYGQQEEWIGTPGNVDLGRPDRRVSVFCDRLAYSGNARGFDLQPAVLFTEGPVEFAGRDSLAAVVHWEEAEGFLQRSFPEELRGLDPSDLIKVLTP